MFACASFAVLMQASVSVGVSGVMPIDFARIRAKTGFVAPPPALRILIGALPPLAWIDAQTLHFNPRDTLKQTLRDLCVAFRAGGRSGSLMGIRSPDSFSGQYPPRHTEIFVIRRRDRPMGKVMCVCGRGWPSARRRAL